MWWYDWIKALHVISVIAWMAGMMYLPRLFVYHAEAPAGSDKSETFKLMERRLYRGIITPAMIATWVFGLAMVFHGLIDWSSVWPWVMAGCTCGCACTAATWAAATRRRTSTPRVTSRARAMR